MLHRIQLPDCVPQLEQIRQFQRDVLALACSPQTVLPLTQEALQNNLGVDRGDWLWRKLWKQRGNPGETSFHLALIAVVEFATNHPELTQTLLDAFDHDVTFHTALDDPDFHFYFNDLDDETHRVLKPFMIAFYEDLLSSGFETAIHGQPAKLDRDAFIESFWRVNQQLEVCPACDRQRSDKVDNKVYDDADHFLPKSKYPFLSLHHENLVPLCLYCNRSFKGDRDPVDDHSNAPLCHTFHPYERPALDFMEVVVNRIDATGVPLIEFEDRAGMPSRRVESLKRVFRLHERWPDQLRYHIGDVRDAVADAGRKWRKVSLELTEEVLQNELQDMLEQRIKKRGRKIGYVLQASYLTFALNDSDELQTLWRAFTGD